MDDIEQQREHFDNISEKYYSARKHKNHLLIKGLIWSYFFNRNSFPEKCLDVLEPMCGYGEGKKILENYAGLNINYTGFDYSQALIDLVKKEIPDLNIYQQDITRFDARVKDQSYDLMILIGGLHHVYEHTEDAIKRLMPALKPGGLFINFEPTQNLKLLKMIREYIYKRNKLFDDETEQAFDLHELNALFTRNGFEIVDQIYPGLLSYILYYNPDAFPFLNLGSERMVKALFNMDKLFIGNMIGRKFSFATLSLFRKVK